MKNGGPDKTPPLFKKHFIVSGVPPSFEKYLGNAGELVTSSMSSPDVFQTVLVAMGIPTSQ